MKQLFLVFILFLFCTICVAQKTISKGDFDHLVDYATSKYVTAFITKNDKDKPYYRDTYIKEVKPKLDKATLDNFNTIISFQNLKELLNNNTSAQKLAETLNKRKKDYDSAKDDKSLIEVLKATKWENINLIPTADIVLNACFKKYGILEGTSAQEIAQEQTILTSSQVEELQSKLDQLRKEYDALKNDNTILDIQKSQNIFQIIIFGLFGFFAIVIIGFYQIRKRNLKEYLINKILNSKRINDKFNQNVDPSTVDLSEQNRNYIINETKDRVLEYFNNNNKLIQKQTKTVSEAKIEVSRPLVKYLKGKNGKVFNRVENTSDNSFFKLFDENYEFAHFEFSGDEVEAIAKRIFSEDICSIVSGSYQNAQSVETFKPGKVKRVGEQWEVIEPVQIKLI